MRGKEKVKVKAKVKGEVESRGDYVI